MPDHETVDAEIAPADTAQTDRHRRRWWTSWQLWIVTLLVGMAGILFVLSIPIVRRAQALSFFDDQKVEYAFSDDDAWITERFGDWARPFRKVTYIRFERPSSQVWNNIAVFDEVEYLALPAEAITWESLAILRELPRLRGMAPDWFIEDWDLHKVVTSEWNVDYPMVTWD